MSVISLLICILIKLSFLNIHFYGRYVLVLRCGIEVFIVILEIRRLQINRFVVFLIDRTYLATTYSMLIIPCLRLFKVNILSSLLL